ncbi:MAG: hypothetical protein NTU53_11180 [Planctomycetota bacterium]|nr:hypothetical protein [Planctomycetota bacterium]
MKNVFSILPFSLGLLMTSDSTMSPGWVWTIAFSPDGNMLAPGSDGNTIMLRDVLYKPPASSETRPSTQAAEQTGLTR